MVDSYERMHNFIKEKGGSVRFDHFGQEHLMGETGYYSHQVDFAHGHGAPTPSRTVPGYAKSVAEAMFWMVLEKVRAQGFGGRPLNFVEIGGGAGNFKREFLALYDAYRQGGGKMVVKYISIEPNPSHRKAQEFPGSVVLEGTAQKTHLNDEIADVVFNDEILDCLPVRMLKFDPKKRKITHEAFVSATPQGLSLSFHPVEREPEGKSSAVTFFEKYLASRNERKEIHTFSPHYIRYWKEIHRILRPGGMCFSIDYGGGPALMTAEQLALGALNMPYQADLTHFIDFQLQERLARMAGFGEVAIQPLIKIIRIDIAGLEGLLHGTLRHMIVAGK